MSFILETRGLGVDFGGIKAVDSVSLGVSAGEILAIIGPNGAGKTTLFNMMSGVYRPARGQVLLHGQDVTAVAPEKLARQGLSRTFQNLQIFFRMTAIENVMTGAHRLEKMSLLPHLLALPSVWRQNAETRAAAMQLLEVAGLAHLADEPAGSLPYGALKRLEIARALAAKPQVLLLDEPAAGCNATETEEIDHIIHTVAKSGIGVVLVEHDMRLVMKISDRVHVLDRGTTLVEGTPQEVRANERVIAAYLGAHGAKEAAHARP